MSLHKAITEAVQRNDQSLAIDTLKDNCSSILWILNTHPSLRIYTETKHLLVPLREKKITGGILVSSKTTAGEPDLLSFENDYNILSVTVDDCRVVLVY